MAPIGEVHPKATYVLGCDVARLGEDETVFTVIEKQPFEDMLYVVAIHSISKSRLTEIIGTIKALHKQFKFVKVYVDETGVGGGVVDAFKADLGVPVEGIVFTLNSKMDMYSNLKVLLEQGKLKIPNHKKLIYQLCDLRYERLDSGRMKIHHSDRGKDDFCDSLVLAAWHFKPRPSYTFSGVY